MEKLGKETWIFKASVRHMGNAFLNGVETSAQEAACLVLQLPLTRMSREVVFLPTSPPDERTFLLKDFKMLQEMDPRIRGYTKSQYIG